MIFASVSDAIISLYPGKIIIKIQKPRNQETFAHFLALQSQYENSAVSVVWQEKKVLGQQIL